MGLYGTNQGDDGYQGPQAASTLTAAQQEMTDLAFQIAQLDELAWGYEDREQIGKASATRAKIHPLKARLDAIVAAQRAVQS